MSGVDILQTDGLPPENVWLVDPRDPNFERLATPVDERGLIEISKLVEAVKTTIDQKYKWQGPNDVHHFYWPEHNYPHDDARSRNTSRQVFHNLPIHKGLVPRVFHNWLHSVTEPPEMPDREVMTYRVEAWDVAKYLFVGRSALSDMRPIYKVVNEALAAGAKP